MFKKSYRHSEHHTANKLRKHVYWRWSETVWFSCLNQHFTFQKKKCSFLFVTAPQNGLQLVILWYVFFFYPKEIQVQNETKRTTILFELMNLKICFLMVPIRILMKQKHLTNHEYPGLYFCIPFSLKGNWTP